MKLMLLEDIKSHASLFQYALEDLGWRDKIELTWVKAIEEAANSIAEPYDLIMLDYKLDGDRYGTEFCEIARARWPYTPIIVMSSMKEWKIYEEIYQAGANAFLGKFSDFDELLDQLNMVLHYYSNFVQYTRDMQKSPY